MSYKYVAMVLATFPAWAGTISVGNNDESRGAYVQYLENEVRTVDFAGVIRAAFDFGSVQDFLSADPYRHIPIGIHYSNTFGAPAGSGLGRVAWLYDYQLITALSQVSGAGLQLAMWDIVADGGDGAATGYIRASVDTPQPIIDAWLHYLSVSEGRTSIYAAFYKNHNIDGVYLETLVGPGDPVPPPPTDGDNGDPGGDNGNPPGGDTAIPEPSTISMIVVFTLAIGLKKLFK